MSEAVNMHYVPQTYLKYFSRKEIKPKGSEYFIKALDTKTALIKEINIKKVCISKNIYIQEGDTPSQRQVVEDMYDDIFEKDYDKLYEILTDDKLIKIEKGKRQMIVATVVSMLYRNKIWNDIYGDYHVKPYDRNFFEMAGIPMDGGKLKRFHKYYEEQIKSKAARSSVTRAFWLSTARTFTDQITVIKLTDEFEFVTSDHPVCCVQKPGRTFMPIDVFNTLSIALNNKYVVILQPTGKDRNIIVRPAKSPALSNEYGRRHNEQQLAQADKFIFGTENELRKFRLQS